MKFSQTFASSSVFQALNFAAISVSFLKPFFAVSEPRSTAERVCANNAPVQTTAAATAAASVRLISLRDIDSRVIVLDDLVELHAHLCEAVSTILTHPDAVSPAATGECVASDMIPGVLLVDNKKLFVQ